MNRESRAIPSHGEKSVSSFLYSCEIECAVFLQQFQITQNVGFNFLGLGFGVKFLQIGDNFGNSMLAVATCNDFQAWAIQAKSTLGHEEDALVVIFTKAATWGKLGLCIRIDRHEAMIARKR